MHAQSKNSPNGPLTIVEELYSLRNKCTLTQAALHTAMNLEIRFRTLTVITIKGLCALFQQKKMTVERTNRSSFSTSIIAKKTVKQLQDVTVPQADLRETTISVRAEIIANFQLLKSDFLEGFCRGDGSHHCELLLVTEKSAEATFMSHVNRSNVHWVWTMAP